MKRLFKNIFKEFDTTFKSIFLINLLYANTASSSMQKKEKYKYNPEEMAKDVFTKVYLLSTVVMIVVYGAIFSGMPFQKMPYIVDYTILVFLFLNVLQTFTYFFNVFYESKDIEGYMSLPISERKVFLAKLAVVSFTTMQLSVPILPVILFYLVKIGVGPLAVVFSILDFLIFWFLIVLLDVVIMQLLAKTTILSKFKTSIITVINIIGMVINVAFIIIIQNVSADFILKSIETKTVLYGPITWIMKNNLSHIIAIVVSLSTIVLFYKLIFNKINGKFYVYIQNLQKNEKINRNKKVDEKGEEKVALTFSTQDTNTSRFFFKYNLSLIKDPTIITQSIISNSIFPIVIIIPMLRNEYLVKYLNGNDLLKLVMALGVGIGFSLMINLFGVMGLSSMMTSLDRENFNYIKSLPIDRKKYFISKLIFGFIFSNIVPTLMLLGILIYFRLSLFAIVVGFLTYMLVSGSISTQWAMYDYKNVKTDWQNVSDLYLRFNKAFQMLLLFAGMVILTLISIGIAALIAYGKIMLVIVAFLGLIAAIMIFCMFRLHGFLKRIV